MKKFIKYGYQTPIIREGNRKYSIPLDPRQKTKSHKIAMKQINDLYINTVFKNDVDLIRKRYDIKITKESNYVYIQDSHGVDIEYFGFKNEIFFIKDVEDLVLRYNFSLDWLHLFLEIVAFNRPSQLLIGSRVHSGSIKDLEISKFPKNYKFLIFPEDASKEEVLEILKDRKNTKNRVPSEKSLNIEKILIKNQDNKASVSSDLISNLLQKDHCDLDGEYGQNYVDKKRHQLSRSILNQ